jgi:hypothetical protein
MVFAAAMLSAGIAAAQTVTSKAPDAVSISIYRAPFRGNGELNLDWLGGYALITETRTVTIPKGRAVIRFEGVAGRILPESAIVTGLPDGVREKNLDADLLSERSLYERSLGRPVTIRRTRDGKVTEERAVIRSGPNGAAIFETAEGFVAADCEQQDAIVYDRVPVGLSAKPTLSIETESPRSGKVTLTLSYLAWGYDWQANYVATMRPGGKSADLFAWVTLANGDVTGFDNAQAMVIAGKPNREDGEEPPRYDPQDLSFRCFATPVADDDAIVAQDMAVFAPAPPSMAVAERSEIVVTGARAIQEDLGDLKLYRIPHATNVAAMSQKQVAMLDQPSVPVDVIFRSRIDDGELQDYQGTVHVLLRAQNRKDKGLGLPLPQGPVAVFEPLGGRSLLIGEGAITDKAIGEEVEIELSAATQVTAVIEDGGDTSSGEGHILTVSNANPYPVRYEAELTIGDAYKLTRTSARLARRKGRDVWSVEVPANGSAKLSYRLTPQ